MTKAKIKAVKYEPYVPIEYRNDAPIDAIARDWLPKHIYAARSHADNPEYLDVLLALEDQRDALMSEIFVARQRALGLEPTGRWHDSAYFHIAIPQALFDQLGHYDKRDVRRVCLAWLLFHDYLDDLSESAQQELKELLEKQVQLKWYAGTYRLPDEYTNTPDVFYKEPADES